ncbi:MAG: hypothetical protein ACRD68_16795 [Pyrinomonadaceae bacterium]
MEGTINLCEPIAHAPSGGVERLVCEFASCALARARWTHEAHLTVALWYLVRHPPAEATRLIRARIQHYNLAHGIRTTKTGGYHETMTLFWVRMVRRELARLAGASLTLEEMAARVVERLGDKSLLLTCYSRARLMSWEARATWMEPDLKFFDAQGAK